MIMHRNAELAQNDAELETHAKALESLALTTAPSDLPSITDPFDATTHEAMDAEVMRKTGGNPSTDDVALYSLLGYVNFDIHAAKVDGSHLDMSASNLLEYRVQLKELLRIGFERQSFRDVRLLECLWPPRLQRSSRWLTISFIRHAQCFGNIHGPHVANADMLTPVGEKQARVLGIAWSNVRVDAIHCSTLNRAKRTAAALARDSVTPSATRWLVERNAPARPKMMGELPEGHEFLCEEDGGVAHESWRDERPDGYGETYADVAARGVHYLLCLFSYHGITLDHPPQLDDLSGDAPDDVPPEIPHIVVVAHNFVLCELYEALMSWNEDGHAASNADFEQTGWSRHVLCLHGSDREGMTGRARLYGRLEQTVLRHPSEYNPENCSSGESAATVTPRNTPTHTPTGTPHSSGVAPAHHTKGVDIPLIAA